MHSSKKSFLFNPEKAAASASNFLSEQESIIGIFFSVKKTIVISNARVGIFEGENQLETSIPLKEIKSLLQNTGSGFNLKNLRPSIEMPKVSLNPLKSPFQNPLKGIASAPFKVVGSHAVELVDGTNVVLGILPKSDWESFELAFEEALNNQIEIPDLKLNTPALRVEEYASIESNISWSKIPKHLQKNIEINISETEKPLFIIGTEGSIAGAIVALPDRCLLIKSGGLGGFMAGSLGGARVATFYYRDITGIEYNSGMVTGVVEILTASYDGSKNKDYWKGTTKSRNADSNDPWTLSNTLPMVKPSYNAAKRQFDKLRALIGESTGSTTASVTNIINSESIADEIEKLSKLLEKNLINEDEFKEAKKRLLGN